MVEITWTFIYDLLIILVIAVLTPIIADINPKLRIPALILEILLGIVIGPYVLGLVQPDTGITDLSILGVSFLFFIAGLEVDLDKLKGKPIKYAIMGWFLSLIIALVIGGILQLSGIVVSFIFTGLALTTTSLGVLILILRDDGDLNSNFGKYVFAAGVIAEFVPLIILALFFNPLYDNLSSMIIFIVYITIALLILIVVKRWHPKFIGILMRKTMNTSGQLAVRTTFVLIIALTAFSLSSGIHFLLGSFLAGIIFSQIIKDYKNDKDVENLRIKFEGIGFGAIIPIFFIVTGINFDLNSFLGNPGTLLMVHVFSSVSRL